MFTNEEIMEAMVDEIGETRTGQSRARVPSSPEDTRRKGVVYLRRSSTCGKTLFRDINIYDIPTSVKHCSDGSQVSNAY